MGREWVFLVDLQWSASGVAWALAPPASWRRPKRGVSPSTGFAHRFRALAYWSTWTLLPARKGAQNPKRQAVQGSACRGLLRGHRPSLQPQDWGRERGLNVETSVGGKMPI